MTRSAAGILLLVIFLPLGLALAAGAATGGEEGLSVYTLVLFMHQLLFVYWLGPDMGVYYLSGRIADPALSDGQRLAAAQTFVQIDLFPRICMSLMLTVGGILTEYVGIPHPPWQWAGILLLGPVWLTMILIQHFKHGTPLGDTVTRLDFYFRWALMIGILGSVVYSWTTGRLESAPWVAGKLILFSGILMFGLLMRIAVKPMMGAIGKLASEGSSDEVNQAMASSLSKTKPFVWGLWACLFLEAFLGVFQPGSPAG